MKILTLNAGSNSLKFECFAVETEARWGKSLLAGSFDDIGKNEAQLSLLRQKQVVHQEKVAAATHEDAARKLFEWLEQGHGRDHGVTSLGDIDRVAHRVVHGADQFDAVVRISSDVVGQIQALEELAPLHNAPCRKVIEAAREVLGPQFPMFAVFDTTFHRDLPDAAALYALPLPIARRHRIRRYGFHGISHHYLALRTAELLERPVEELKLITLHLEGGSSVAAIERGRSIDTSMGFTPLEGLMMGTRSGDLDPAIGLYLMRKEGWSAAETERFLNKECGLQGVSGVSADTRELTKQLANPDVDLALNIFCYRVKKYVGAYLAALGGADAIVFGGGIGENTPLIRSRICARLEWAGAELDEDRNRDVVDCVYRISAPDARIPIWVVPTQEGLMMARHAVRPDGSQRGRNPAFSYVRLSRLLTVSNRPARHIGACETLRRSHLLATIRHERRSRLNPTAHDTEGNPMEPLKPLFEMKSVEVWWPASLGKDPSSAGSANGDRYAYFGATHRLAIARDGTTEVYDTTGHEIRGVAQDANSESGLVFNDADGSAVDVNSLKRLS